MLGESGWSRPVPLPLWPLLLHVAEGVWAQQTVQQYWHCRVGWRICTQSKPVLKLQRKYTLTPAPSSVTQAYQSLDLFPFTLPLLNTLTSATLTLSLNFHRRRMGCRTATLSWLYMWMCLSKMWMIQLYSWISFFFFLYISLSVLHSIAKLQHNCLCICILSTMSSAS